MSKATPKIVPVILAGGSGTRLWPLSRELHPKQFLSLAGEQSLLEQTLTRLDGLKDLAPPVVVAGEDHRFLVAERVRSAGMTGASIVLEPAGRNTAPAVAIAAFEAAAAHGPDALLLVMPSDHVMTDVSAFRTAVEKVLDSARTGKLVTFGIVPSAPETGYGYIKAGKSLGDGVLKVDAFVEKPDAETARKYLADGGYFWNSGMFLFRADVYLGQLDRLAPDIAHSARAAHAASARDSDFLRVGKDAFLACRSDSIDYAVMEKAGDAVVMPLDAGWNDLGSWSSVAAIAERNERGNVVQGDVLVEDSENCFLRSEGRLIAALGLRDQIVVETPDAVLVADKERIQDVKKLVQQLQQASRKEAREHRTVYRPWGSYEDLVEGPRFRVKRIVVNPGGRLSLQLHHHRAEHWVIVTGTAKVTRGDEEMLLGEDQSTYIPLGTAHRLENPGKMPLELIEVQTGGYVGEDDIVRLDDVYGRIKKG